MSNLDVQVLQSFTRKLAYAAEKMAYTPATMGMTPGVQLDAPPSGSPANAKPLPSGVNDGKGTMAGSPPPSIPALTTNSDLPAELDFNAPGTPDSANVTTTADPTAPPALSSEAPPRNWRNFLYDNAGSIGAAGAGGLGAMALARLFNSSKDDEEESSWAPWLAGAAGAGLGYGAWNYGPQIQQALAGMLGGGDSAAPAPPTPPAAA